MQRNFRVLRQTVPGKLFSRRDLLPYRTDADADANEYRTIDCFFGLEVW